MLELGPITVIHGKCANVLAAMPENSVDSIVCDPPYGLSFMGKAWDYDVPPVADWQHALRVLKPGGHLLAFSGSRTYHRMVVNIEDAGFEIRDQIMWVYGSGFPKSLNVSKALDNCGHPSARQWEGWGTALKPAHEPIVVARKPLVGTVAANVLAHGVGGLNIDGCRVPSDAPPKPCTAPGWDSLNAANAAQGYRPGEYQQGGANYVPSDLGRFPANLIHDGSDEVLGCFPETKSGTLTPEMLVKPSTGWSGGSRADRVKSVFTANEGSAARFFYCAKAGKSDRGEGNDHPTVKPHDLMRYLCRLVTPPNGLVLDHYAGSGSTGLAAMAEGFRAVLIEQDEHHYDTAIARIATQLWSQS